jgi:hypothetical protein
MPNYLAVKSAGNTCFGIVFDTYYLKNKFKNDIVNSIIVTTILSC